MISLRIVLFLMLAVSTVLPTVAQSTTTVSTNSPPRRAGFRAPPPPRNPVPILPALPPSIDVSFYRKNYLMPELVHRDFQNQQCGIAAAGRKTLECARGGNGFALRCVRKYALQLLGNTAMALFLFLLDDTTAQGIHVGV
jgi:hypothetical protein